MQRSLLISLTLLLLALAANATDDALPAQSVIMPGIDEAAMQEHFKHVDLQPLEGIWYYPDENMTVAIMRDAKANAHEQRYVIMLLASDDLDLLPGTVIGCLEPSAERSKLRLWLYSERSHITLFKPMECVATASKDGSTITFTPPRWRVRTRINLGSFLPSIFHRMSVYPEKSQETLPHGFTKVYPTDGNGNAFSEIRYL